MGDTDGADNEQHDEVDKFVQFCRDHPGSMYKNDPVRPATVHGTLPDIRSHGTTLKVRLAALSHHLLDACRYVVIRVLSCASFQILHKQMMLAVSLTKKYAQTLRVTMVTIR